MSNDHLDAHFRVIFDRLTASHRVALEELRDGNAALARAAAKGKLNRDGTRQNDASALDEARGTHRKALEAMQKRQP